MAAAAGPGPGPGGRTPVAERLDRAPRRAPWPLAAVAALALALILGPVAALGLRVPWAGLPGILAEPDTTAMLRLSLAAAVQSTLLAVAAGVPLAVTLAGARGGARLARFLVLLPLAMPPVVAGMALTAALGTRGVAAPVLDALGLEFAFAFPGVVLSHVFISLPFVVIAVDSALRQLDPEIPDSAAGVGMSRAAVLTRVTLPAVAPAVASGAGLAFARSLGEFGTTLTFAGSMPGVTRTMPLGIYLERELDQDRAYALAAVLIAVAVAAIAAAAAPALLRRTPAPVARAAGAIDVARMRELTRPTAPPVAVTVGAGEAATVFAAGATTALVGPNGSGKSTLAGLIAGRLRGGRIRVGDTVVDAPGVFVPARRRGVVLLTQAAGLPRTATVASAVAMATGDRALARELLAAAGLAELAEVRVPALSGGQAAQVALVRALGARPGVLILDEPLAAVDADSTRQWHRLLAAAAADRTTLLVTHDPVEVAGLCSAAVVLEAGGIVARLSPDELSAAPPTRFAAELMGLNRLTGTIVEVRPGADGAGEVLVDCAGTVLRGGLSADRPAPAPGDPAMVTWAPSAGSLERVDDAAGGPAAGDPDGGRSIAGTVARLRGAPGDGAVAAVVAVGEAEITVAVPTAEAIARRLRVGAPVRCQLPPGRVSVHPAG